MPSCEIDSARIHDLVAFPGTNKRREGLSKFNSTLDAILRDVRRSVCQVSNQVSMIFEHTGLCKLTIACLLPDNIA